MQYLTAPTQFTSFRSGKSSRQGSRNHSPQPSGQLSRQFSFGTIPDPEEFNHSDLESTQGDNSYSAMEQSGQSLGGNFAKKSYLNTLIQNVQLSQNNSLVALERHESGSTEESGSEKALADENEYNLAEISRRQARFGSYVSGVSEDDGEKSQSSSTSRSSSRKPAPKCTISPSALVFGGDVSQEEIMKHATGVHSGLKHMNNKISSALKGLVLSKTVSLTKKTNKFNRTLVLDLDETLITTKKDENDHDPKVAGTEFELKIRPFAEEFIKKMSKEFEIIVFSSAERRYVEVITKVLDPKRQYISHIFHRDHCIKTPQGLFVKDLRIFKGRELRDMVIVDNLVQSFSHQIENGIPIVSWYGDRSDQELKHLMEYLKECKRTPDMRLFNRKRLQLASLATISLEEFLDN